MRKVFGQQQRPVAADFRPLTPGTGEEENAVCFCALSSPMEVFVIILIGIRNNRSDNVETADDSRKNKLFISKNIVAKNF